MKVRAPLTTDQALARIIGQLPNGYRDAEKATDRSESYLRACGDPDRLERLCFDDAIALDIAFQAAGGEGSPLAEHFLLRVEMGQLARFAHRFGLLEKTEQVVRESGEASAALIRACQPGAGPLEPTIPSTLSMKTRPARRPDRRTEPSVNPRTALQLAGHASGRALPLPFSGAIYGSPQVSRGKGLHKDQGPFSAHQEDDRGHLV
jgi:hypothetical protein